MRQGRERRAGRPPRQRRRRCRRHASPLWGSCCASCRQPAAFRAPAAAQARRCSSGSSAPAGAGSARFALQYLQAAHCLLQHRTRLTACNGQKPPIPSKTAFTAAPQRVSAPVCGLTHRYQSHPAPTRHSWACIDSAHLTTVLFSCTAPQRAAPLVPCSAPAAKVGGGGALRGGGLGASRGHLFCCALPQLHAQQAEGGQRAVLVPVRANRTGLPFRARPPLACCCESGPAGLNLRILASC
jgi:hypothetical protein